VPRGTKGTASANLGEEVKPVKNGWLAVAVVGSILTMLALVGADLYLIRHPAVSVKLFGKSSDAGDQGASAGQEKNSASASRAESCKTAPEMTFYTRLAVPSDAALRPEEKEGLPVDKPGFGDEGADVAKTTAKPHESGSTSDAKLGAAAAHSQSYERSLPEPQKGSPVYTVQVGAFTQPGIAQEWAAKWKARGYEVALKPVARPKTGIIYRLYLGSFSSEKSAEELVRHLKVKEGISAFTLVLRN
jgi:cell division septation protein DedD